MLTSTKTSIAIVVACVALSTGAWAVIGPDSIWQNQVMDKIRATNLDDCSLYQVKKGEGNIAIICVAGWQANEPLSLETAHRCFDLALANLEAIDKTSEIGVWEEVSVYFFLYDTAQNPEIVGEKFYLSLEADPFLTKASTQYVFFCHSLGGWIATACELAGAERKSLGSLNAGVPWLGTPLADRNQIEKARNEIYTKVGEIFVGMLMSYIDFETESLSWLRPSSNERKDMLGRVNFSNKYLYVGAYEPSSTDVISRNLNLVTIFDAWSWKSDAMRDKKAYGLGASFIQKLGYKGSDGVVPLVSASAKDYADVSKVSAVGIRNHSQVIAGNQGDILLHQLMYRDFVSLLPVKKTKEFGDFDVWVPDVPIFDLPDEWGKRISRSRLVFSDQGVLKVAQYSGDEQMEIGTHDVKAFWPKWIGDTIIFSGQSGRYSDIYWISDNNEMFRLTHDGESQWAVPVGGGMTFVMQSRGKLVLASIGGIRRVLVDEKLNLHGPPIVIGKKIYFTHGNGVSGKYNLYWVSVDAHEYSLEQAKLVAKSVVQPLNLKGALLAVDNSTDDVKLIFLTQKWLQKISFTVQYANKYDVTRLESLVTSNDGHIYIVFDGKIRLVDKAVIETAIVTVTMPSSVDKVLPVIAVGNQLDVR